jgi:hypothetical protein
MGLAYWRSKAKHGDILILPWREFLARLWDDAF